MCLSERVLKSIVETPENWKLNDGFLSHTADLGFGVSVMTGILFSGDKTLENDVTFAPQLSDAINNFVLASLEKAEE